VIVIYDIFDDDRRAAVRTGLRPVADRFQQSGWFLPPDVGITAPRVIDALGTLLAPGDRLGAYEPCPRCLRHALWLPEGAWRPPVDIRTAWLARAGPSPPRPTGRTVLDRPSGNQAGTRQAAWKTVQNPGRKSR
jgi:hypothetical protein